MSTVRLKVGDVVVCVEPKRYDTGGIIVAEGAEYTVASEEIDGGDQFVRVRLPDGSLSPNLFSTRFVLKDGVVKQPVSPVIKKIRAMEERWKDNLDSKKGDGTYAL